MIKIGSRTKVSIAVVVLAAITATSHVYLILEDIGGTALWNAKEAYFFVGINRVGHRVNGLRFPYFLVENLIAGPETPNDRTDYLVVIRVAPPDVERHVLTLQPSLGTGPGQYTPKKGRIYANYPALGGLCFWAGDRFEQATQEERQGFDGIEGLTEKDFDSGWSSRGFWVGPQNSRLTFRINVNNNSELSVNSAVAIAWHRSFSINLLRAGHSPERIWDLGLRWGVVRAAEYREAFRDRD
jgi:hypothetical protein